MKRVLSGRWALLFLLGAGCDELPDDVEGYQDRCVRLNKDPILPYESDPHQGHKNVFACGLSKEAVVANARPFAAGVMIVKESRRDGESFPWLVAVARKQASGWRWDEYTRNFDDEPLRRLLVAQGKCTGCHERAKAVDYIFTQPTGL